MRNKISKIILLMFVLVLSSFYVNAFALSMPYLKDDTRVLSPGEGVDFNLWLQNMVGTSDETVQVVISEGSEIARLVDKNNIYDIPKGARDIGVKIRIDIPEDMPLGTEMNVRFKVSLVSEGEGGMVQISKGLSDGFKVKVASKPAITGEIIKEEESSASSFFVLIGLLLVITVLVVVSKKRKKK